jgi:hypothetical protein
MKDIIQTLKENNCQPRVVCPEKLSYLIEGETKTFHHKEKLKEFVTTKPALEKILKGLLHIEEETKARQIDSRNNKPFFSKQINKKGIDKIKQQENKNDWKQQALLNTSTECLWPQCPNQET